MISKIFSLRNYVIKQLTKTNKKGIMQIPDKGKIDFGEMIIKENLFKKGIDPKLIKSEQQLDNILNTPTIPPHSTPKKSGEVIQFPEDRITDWTKPRPTKKAYGGIAGLGERTGFKRGTKPEKKQKLRSPPPRKERPGYRKVYEFLEDIPEEALALMKKDPNFDLQTFLETVKWSEPEETRFKKIKKHGKYSEEDIPWGIANPSGQYLNYLPFGEKESIGDGLLGLKNPSDMDKVSTVMHEMRHSKMNEPWFAKSSAVPKWVQEYEEKGDPHYLDKDIKDKHSQYRDTQKDVSGEELYTRFLDQHFYPDAAKKGELAGSDYEPYFDKILKDKWAPNLKAYKDILKEEKRVKSKPYGLAYGGVAGLLGEPTYEDENHRVPYGEGSSWEQFQKEKMMQLMQEYQQYLENKEKEERQKPYLEERLGIGPGPVLEAAEGGRTGFKKGHSAGRRNFLKILGGLATIPLVGKYFKWAKPLAKSSKVLTSVPIKSGVDGMPLWFKPLVNKVIKEGDDITKKFATAEREIVHKTKLPDSQTDVIVTQNLDSGDVVVDIGLTKHGFRDGHLGQPVRLEYKASEVIEPENMMKAEGRWSDGKPTGPGKKTKEEFWVEEAEFTGGHPENVKFEESTFEKFGEHGSDFSEVEEFATGLKKGKGGSGHMASGGRVPLKKGKVPKGPNEWLQLLEIDWDDMDPDEWVGILRSLGVKGHASGGRVPLAGGAIVKGGKWFIKSLTDTRKQLKTMRLSPGQLKQYLDQIDDQIRRIKAGEKIPDEIIQTIRKDPKFKSVWQNQLSADPELREMEEVLLEYGQKHASGGLAGMLGE